MLFCKDYVHIVPTCVVCTIHSVTAEGFAKVIKKQIRNTARGGFFPALHPDNVPVLLRRYAGVLLEEAGEGIGLKESNFICNLLYRQAFQAACQQQADAVHAAVS